MSSFACASEATKGRDARDAHKSDLMKSLFRATIPENDLKSLKLIKLIFYWQLQLMLYLTRTSAYWRNDSERDLISQG